MQRIRTKTPATKKKHSEGSNTCSNCCLFLAPFKTQPAPLLPSTVPNWSSQESWYDSNYFCSQYVDETAVFPEIGGCKYDYPMGQCMDIDVDIIEDARGCAYELETHMTSKVRH